MFNVRTKRASGRIDYSLRARDRPRKPQPKAALKTRTSTKAALLKKLKTPSRLEIKPYYKTAKRSPNEQGRSFKEPRRKTKTLFQNGLSLSTTCFSNKYKASRMGSSGLSLSDLSIQEMKSYKLSDFGLCVNVNERRPASFGRSRYLAPEVLRLGPDHPKVRLTRSISGSWTCTRWA